MASATLPGRRVALLDGGSFVLPYDYGLATGLVDLGYAVVFFGSRTRFNGEFLRAVGEVPGISLELANVSGSVAARWRGVLAYAGLLLRLWRRRAEFGSVNLQFSVLWPLELPLLALMRCRLVFTVHNAVPHGHPGRTHAPTAWIARLARHLVFASEAARDDFMRRYGPGFAAKSTVLQHGLLPLAPGRPVVPYRPAGRPEAVVFWGSVKPYKGVELMAELARSAEWRAQGLALEVHGRWDAALAPLRAELISLGVRVVDDYLDAAALDRLMSRRVVFLLPYLNASQSGALYTLLHQGCHFFCADTGDLGAFLRRHGLPELRLGSRTPEAVIGALKALAAAPERVADALQQAQDDSAWNRTLADADLVFVPATQP